MKRIIIKKLNNILIIICVKLLIKNKMNSTQTEFDKYQFAQIDSSTMILQTSSSQLLLEF